MPYKASMAHMHSADDVIGLDKLMGAKKDRGMSCVFDLDRDFVQEGSNQNAFSETVAFEVKGGLYWLDISVDNSLVSTELSGDRFVVFEANTSDKKGRKRLILVTNDCELILTVSFRYIDTTQHVSVKVYEI